jgi:Leucine-rich repeat (LRR) protein
LETLDLHGNVLIQLPIGLRRLELVTALNIVIYWMYSYRPSANIVQSNNKLGNDCFQVISQIKSLRDLKIGGNLLAGPLDASITNLQNLEALDVQRNSITSLPEGFSGLGQLRVLNINENRFTSLPFQTLRRLPLIELSAAKNNLTGTLVTADVEELPKLQILDVTSNALTSLDLSGVLSLPSLHQLSCSSNRLTGLPDMASWVALLTLAAEDNNIESIPDGFVTLPKVKNVNFNGNNLRVLDDRIGGMESLDILRIGGNPLRDKKFSGMTTEDLKRALKARMAPPEPEADKEMEADGAFYSAPVSPISPRSTTSEWPVKPGGVLDRSNTQAHSLNPVTAADIAANHAIKVLELHHNLFKEIPSSVAFFAATLTTLSLAHNELTSDTFLKDDLELPALKELNLSSNTFNSVQPLIQRLKAPLLERLDISFNRLTSLPPLKRHFPGLTTLLASNNTIRELSPESIKGLRVVDCSSNDINSLNARIGLLGGPGGLERLDVKGNRFRVPKYTILEKGTEATLSWLRDRIPAGESSPTDVD